MSTYINSITKNKDIAGVFVVTTAILMMPLVAMQFTKEVVWTLYDFIVMGTLLSGTGLLMVFAARKIKNTHYKAAVIITLLIALLLIWAELAVGLFGSPFARS